MIKFFYLALLLVSAQVNAQDIIATYEVTMDIGKMVANPGVGKIDPLKFKGYYYKKGGRIISYWVPGYLDKYPTGRIEFQLSDGSMNTVGIISLSTDSIMNIHYSDNDSLIWRYTDFIAQTGMQKPCSFKYERGFKKWEIKEERKLIAGLQCQRALNYNEFNQLSWDVWFYPDIIIERGVASSFDVPGLIVEAVDIGAGVSYTLQSYFLNGVIDDRVFWPTEFNKAFTHRGTIRNKN